MSQFDYKSVTIRQAATALGVKLNPTGNSSCINPSAHNNGDRKPSFSILKGGTNFNCFGCGIKGNVVDFVKIVQNVDAKEAIQWLRENFDSGHGSMKSRKRESVSNSTNTTETKRVVDPESMKKSQVWMEKNVFVSGLLKLGISLSHLKEWNVGVGSEKAVLFHYQNMEGQITTTKTIVYQANLKRDKSIAPKFLKGHIPCLYGEHILQEDHREKEVFLVESEKSALICSAYLSEYQWIATGGAGKLTDSNLKVLTGRNVFICFDSDVAGRQYADKNRQMLEKSGITARVIDLFPERNDGYDIADYLISWVRKNHEKIKSFSSDDQKRFKALYEQGHNEYDLGRYKSVDWALKNMEDK